MTKRPTDTFDHSDPGEISESSFLNRWSARKLKTRQESAQLAPATQPEPLEPALTPRALTDADMPPLETLGEKSDYSAFFSPKVSAVLRRQALRKLFHSPSYNVTDGLDDYAEDYTQFASLGDIVTQDMRHMMDVIAKREEARPEPDIESHAIDNPQLAANNEAAMITAAADDNERQTECKETKPQDDEPPQA